jgi:FkbM family methyltransferase
VKTFFKYILQRTLGLKNYLYLFSLFIIKKLPWDKHEKDFLFFLNMLPEEGVVLDIGANLGVMSYYLAKNHPERQVLAFEPIPYNFRNLTRIVRKFKLSNIQLFQLALGDKNGTVEMVLPVEHSVRFHGLAHVKHETIREKNEGEVFECPVKRLDDVIAGSGSKNLRIAGIKIDVENFEYYVLKGAENLLKQHKPLIYCELWDNENRRKTMEFLKSLGYKAQVLENKKLTDYLPESHATQNFFFNQD